MRISNSINGHLFPINMLTVSKKFFATLYLDYPKIHAVDFRLWKVDPTIIRK